MDEAEEAGVKPDTEMAQSQKILNAFGDVWLAMLRVGFAAA